MGNYLWCTGLYGNCFMGLNYKKIKMRCKVIGTGFEPVPPKRLVPETSALDRSATQPRLVAARAGRFACIKMHRETKTSDTGNRTPGICVTGRDVTNYTISDHLEYLGFDPSTSCLLSTHASDCANTPW